MSCLRVNDKEWRRTPAPVAVHEESCWFKCGGWNVEENPKRLVPCLGPHGMTEKDEFLWTYTPHVGSTFLLCVKKNCCRDRFWDFWALEQWLQRNLAHLSALHAASLPITPLAFCMKGGCIFPSAHVHKLFQRPLFAIKRSVQIETPSFHSKGKEEGRRKANPRTEKIGEASGDRNKWVSESKGGKGGGKEVRREGLTIKTKIRNRM